MVVSFDDDFNKAMRDLDFFSSELVKIIESELDRLLRDMEAERVGGTSDADGARLGSDESTVGVFQPDGSLFQALQHTLQLASVSSGLFRVSRSSFSPVERPSQCGGQPARADQSRL